MTQWLPIDSAPKDGTPVLIWQPDGGLHLGEDKRERHQPERDGPISYYDDWRWAIGYWRPWGGWGNRNSARVNPTHWMPLPDPPATNTAVTASRVGDAEESSVADRAQSAEPIPSTAVTRRGDAP